MTRLHLSCLVILAVSSNACKVTEVGNNTQYTVPESNASRCSYSWFDSDGHKLADEAEVFHSPVSAKTETTLLTSKRLNVTYERICMPEGIPFKTTCPIPFAEEAEHEIRSTEGTAAPNITKPPQNSDQQHIIIGVPVAATVTAIVIFVVVIFALWCNKAQIRRKVSKWIKPTRGEQQITLTGVGDCCLPRGEKEEEEKAMVPQ